jgi:hypothetical protein
VKTSIKDIPARRTRLKEKKFSLKVLFSIVFYFVKSEPLYCGCLSPKGVHNGEILLYDAVPLQG